MLAANIDNIQRHIESLQQFNDTVGDGVTRLTFTPSYQDAVDYIVTEMERVGLHVTFDRFGNVIGRFEGTEPLPPVVIGSHLDSVPHGGAFDGVAGIIAGLEVARMFHEQQTTIRRPFEVIAFIEEEGGRFEDVMIGSRAMMGDLSEETFLTIQDANGITIKDAFPTTIDRTTARGVQTERDIAAFLELHIEQDTRLEEKNASLGIVESIGGFEQFHIIVRGVANHAGTTPMSERADALVAASKMIGTFPTLIKDFEEDGTVLTVGSLNVSPNGKNVIPDYVHFTIDLRSHTAHALHEATERVLRFIELHNTEQLHVTIEHLFSFQPKRLSISLQQQLLRAADVRRYSTLQLKSRAGHDAMTFASYVPTALLFVPSKDGISHAKEEWTDFEDIAKGTNVLYDVVSELTR